MTKYTLLSLLGFDHSKHRIRTEVLAGVTTFLTMSYILAVNPLILGDAGMDKAAVFSATVIAAAVATLVMAFYAKMPFALASGMGLNAFFAYTLVAVMGYTWQEALAAVFFEGVIFIILTVTKVRSWLLNAIPGTLKKAIGAGIGLFIAFIGLQNAGIVVNSDATLVTLGDITHGTALLALIGLAITAALVMAKVKGGILIGMLATAVLGLVIKDPATGAAITTLPSAVVSMPHSIAPIFCQFEWAQVLSLDMLVVVFTFLFIDMFDTMGTLIGVCQGTELGEKENIDGIEKMFLADSVATVAGACFGTSTTTTYVESASGVGEGGRTGLTAFSIACCFMVALFFSPIFLAIPGAATAPALVIVGVMMMHSIKVIHWEDYCRSIPAFLTIILMPLTYSISDGILIGVIAYVVTHAISGKAKDISITMWILAALFILRYIFI